MTNLNYDKSALIGTLTARLGAGLETLAVSAESARQASVEAPGAMQSRYDSGKEEQGYLADAHNLRALSQRAGMSRIGFLDLPESPVNVGVGCVVRVEDDFGTDDYLILPHGGGETIGTAQGEVTVVTPEAPLAQALIGLKKGESGAYTANERSIRFRVIDFI